MRNFVLKLLYLQVAAERVMEKKSDPSLLLSSLLLTGLCIDATIITQIISYPSVWLNWTEARHLCRSKHVDLMTLSSKNYVSVLQELVQDEEKYFWIGLFSDLNNDRGWTWINVSGEDSTGIRLSENDKWMVVYSARRCTVLDDDQMWHTEMCQKHYPFYCSSGNIIQYSKEPLNWDNASNYCRSNNMNLITVTENNTGSIKSSGWIGLELAGNRWSWSGGMKSDYRNWAAKEPALNNCVLYKGVNKIFKAKDCARKSAAVCQDDNLVVVKENKTWEDALNHCRQMDSPCDGSWEACSYKYNLLTLQDSYYQYVRDRIYRATTDEVWTGLRFLAGSWWWMDGRKVANNGQLPICPSQQRHCGTLSKYDTNNWIIRDCAEKRNFVCYAL